MIMHPLKIKDEKLKLIQEAMTTNIAGDLLTSGSVLNPALGAVLIDTGALTTGYPDHGYYDLICVLGCTVAGTFTIGSYDSSNTAIQIFNYTIAGGSSTSVSLHNVPLVDGNKFRIVVPVAIIGTANVAMNISLSGGD